MKLNKEEIIFKAKEDASSPTGYKLCSYCGLSSFSHIHKPNTLPKDFEKYEPKTVDEIRIDWKDLVYTDGKIDEKKVMKELSDFDFLMKQASIVYEQIAGLSKVTYTAETILREHEKRCLNRGITKDDVKMLIEKCSDLEELKKTLKNYFEIK